MSSIPAIFDICKQRPDVQVGTTKDEQFAADLAHVVSGTAPEEYKSPAVFFERRHPTRGLRDLLKAVCSRLSIRGGRRISARKVGEHWRLRRAAIGRWLLRAGGRPRNNTGKSQEP